MQLLAAFLRAALVICLITVCHFPEQLGKADSHQTHIYRKIKHLRLVLKCKEYTFDGTAQQRGDTINVGPCVYRPLIYDPIHLSLEIDFVFLDEALLVLPLSFDRSPSPAASLSIVTAAVLRCAVFSL